MNPRWPIYALLICLLLGCRAHHYAHTPKVVTAAGSVLQLEDKIRELHLYGLLALGQELKGQKHKARAARIEMEKIEKHILKAASREELQEIITRMGIASPLYASTLKQLAQKLNVKIDSNSLSHAELMKEITRVKITREFQVFETNVEHLSYMHESNARP